jgi:redox-sensitive bicupin YhaK (pirin superfamily)
MAITRRALLQAGLLAPFALACTPGTAQPTRSRRVTRVLPARPTTDGAGVQLSRALGHEALPMLDPFLMLDEIHSNDPSDYLAGFPSHPHRGFETVTYMLEGVM